MHKRDLINALARVTGFTQAKATKIVKALFADDGVITEALGQGDRVEIAGFGTFEMRTRKARMGRNPQTGQEIKIEPVKYPAFKAARALRERVQDGGGSRAPQGGIKRSKGKRAGKRSGKRRSTRGEARIYRPGRRSKPGEETVEPGSEAEGIGGAGEPQPEDQVSTIVSAEAPRELRVDESGELRIRIERDGPDADPLKVSEAVLASSKIDFWIFVSVHGSAIELVDPWLKSLPPPKENQPSTVGFEIRGVETGTSMVDVKFVQGSQPVAAFALLIHSVSSRSSETTVSARSEALFADPKAYERTMYLVIAEHPGQRSTTETTYSYTLIAPWIGLSDQWEQTLNQDTEEYLKRLHRELVDHIRAQSEADEESFAREIVAKGLDMCDLLPKDLVRKLWDQRESVDHVLLNTKEKRPLPWELLCFKHPDRQDSAGRDNRHLAEYGMTRQLGSFIGKNPLEASRWGYMFAEYPHGTYPATNFGRSYFESDLARDSTIQLQPLPIDPTELVDAISAMDLDVIHISCHGESDLDSSDSTKLILSDQRVQRNPPEGPRNSVEPVKLTPEYVRNWMDLGDRTPIVFLNACESGRRPPGMHGPQGWPDVFIDKGAGAFVGTSWSVKGEVAEAFAVSFYEGLRSGDTLAEATRAGRSAAKSAKQDASWLAYSVYGNPYARLQSRG